MTAVTVTTYNVRAAGLDDGAFAWPRRRAGVREVLRSLSPDVLALQEPTDDQRSAVADALPSLSWHGDRRGVDPGAANPVGVGDRFAVEGSTVEWLSTTPSAPGSVGWDAAEPRTVTRVDLRDSDSDCALSVFATHFDHRGERARERSARLLRERVDALPDERSALVVGDLNCRPGSTPYRVLTGGGFDRPLADARDRAAAVDGPETTVTDWRSLTADSRLDHVFLTPDLPVDRYHVRDRTVDGRYPSDHLPVSVDLRVPP